MCNEVEVCNEHSIDQFRNEIANSNIYNKLDHTSNPNANSNKNYELAYCNINPYGPKN